MSGLRRMASGAAGLAVAIGAGIGPGAGLAAASEVRVVVSYYLSLIHISEPTRPY